MGMTEISKNIYEITEVLTALDDVDPGNVYDIPLGAYSRAVVDISVSSVGANEGAASPVLTLQGNIKNQYGNKPTTNTNSWCRFLHAASAISIGISSTEKWTYHTGSGAGAVSIELAVLTTTFNQLSIYGSYLSLTVGAYHATEKWSAGTLKVRVNVYPIKPGDVKTFVG